jgi:hypothetical protein
MQKIKLPKDPVIEFYFLVGAIAYVLVLVMFFMLFGMPRDGFANNPTLNLRNFLIDLEVGYALYFAYIGIYVPPLFASLLAYLALVQKRVWCLLLLSSHYAYGLWKFFSHDLKGSFLNIFTSEAWSYFLHIKASVLLILPFLLLNLFILGLLFWPRKEKATSDV